MFEKMIFDMPIGTEYESRTRYTVKLETKQNLLNLLTHVSYEIQKA